MEDQLIAKLLDPEILFWEIGGAIAIIAIVFTTVTGMIRSISRERTRREIAAYIAEGSMTPEQGEKILKAGGDS